MGDFPVVLFPHNHMSDPELKKILSFFGPLTIFQPWSMERPVLSAVRVSEPPYRILHPPENLKPDGRLKALLSEYRSWISRHHERSRMDFIKAVQGRGTAEVSTWEIRQTLREGVQGTSAPAKEDTLRRHLLLHLAQDIEDQRREANTLLSAAKDNASPLQDALGEEVTNRDAFLGDLPAFDSEPIFLDDHLDVRLEAWLGLFGRTLKGDEFLVTCAPHITAYVGASRAGRSSAAGPAGQAALRFRVPDLSSYEFEDLQKSKAALMRNSRAGELKESLLEYRQNPSGDLTALAKRAEEVEVSFPWESATGALAVTVTFPDPAGTTPPTDPVTRILANHPLILVQATALP